MTNIAIIPARGGSKRIPRKNIREVNGLPLIAYPIKAAIKSGVFDMVVVSTEDLEIAEISKRFGAIVPFVRDATLADDFTSTISVIKDSIIELSKLGINAINYCCIYPTSIFAKPDDLIKSSELCQNLDFRDFLMSVVKYAYPTQRALEISVDGKIAFVDPSFENFRTQDLTERFHDAAQFYWGKKSAWVQNDSIFRNAIPYKLDSSEIQDIDDEEDLRKAALLLKIREI